MKAVFIVGCPRSGTTLLQSFVGAHHEVYTLPETHFFGRTVSRRSIGRRLGLVRPDVLRAYKWLARADLSIELPNFVGLPDPRMGSWGQSYREAVTARTRQNNASTFLEKSPENLHYIPEIRDVFPEAKFVHILRNGVAVSKSILKAANADPETWRGRHRSSLTDISKCAERWADDVLLSAEYLAQESTHFFVSYESLVSMPKFVLNSLFEFLDIESSPHVIGDAMASRATAAGKLVMSHESWKGKNTQELRSPDHADDADHWRSQLTKDVRRKAILAADFVDHVSRRN